MYIISKKDCQNHFLNEKNSTQDNVYNSFRSYKSIIVYVHRVIIRKYSKLCLVHKYTEKNLWPQVRKTFHFVLPVFCFFTICHYCFKYTILQ